ncbi:MAG: DUF559 domain-containing protein [Solirubrobacterales bacterium]
MSGERKKVTRPGPADSTAEIVRLATCQHGVVARRQALEAGISRGLLTGRVASGWLVPIFSGVYSPGTGQLATEGRWMAAVLVAGNGAVLSHFSAAALHGFIERRTVAIEVIRTGGGITKAGSLSSIGADRFEVTVHRTRTLPDWDCTEVDGIPVTSVARTFLDLAARISLGRLKTALTEAEKLRLLNLPELEEIISRGRGWTGVKKLRRALAEWDTLEVATRSTLEIAMLRLCRRHGIPAPLVNSVVGAYMPDFLWPEDRLIVEVDGYGSHSDRRAFKGDRHRDVDLMLAGYRVARFPYDEVIREGPRTAARLRGLLDLCRLEGTGK